MVDLPGVNTPQFDWARARTSHTPRPMGRPVEPEVAADAVFRAVDGSWREYWLGLPTLMLILGNAVAPGWLDRYMAKTAIAGQQTGTRVSPARPDNLGAPLTALHRTRGSFSGEARTHAPLLPGELARIGAITAGALLFLCLGAAFGRQLGGRKSGSE
jgi:hypothetical protein